MRILHITDGIPPLTLGGTGRIVEEIARGQRAAGHETAILTSAKAGMMPETIDGVRIFTIEPKSDRWAHWRCVFSESRKNNVLAKIDVFRPDVIHAHTVSRQNGYRWMPEVKKRGTALIVTCHDVSHVSYGKVTGFEKSLWMTEMLRYRWSWNPFRHAMIRKYLASADTILTVSDALKSYLTKRGIEKLRTLHNGIDCSFWKPEISKADARKKLNLPEESFLFLLAGRMGVDKGSTLIAATLPVDARLVLAGDGFSDEFAPVKDRLHLFHNQNAEQMRLQYAATDCVLVPSRCLDCFPTVCLEAMAMERPVLATSWGGAKESVKDDVTGWILDPLDPRAWKEKMEWCIDHPENLAEAGTAGRQRVSDLFMLETSVRKLLAIYQEASK